MKPPLQPFLRKLGYALLERGQNARFALLTDAPAWFAKLWPGAPGAAGYALGERSAFLENFLFEAEAFWSKGEDGSLDSGAWVEGAADGEEIPLEAAAWNLEGRRLLVLHGQGQQYTERVETLQTARSGLLSHEKLLREIQKKEILLHCIIHDLSQPLGVMSVAFDCLAGEELSGRAAEFLELGKRAGAQQEAMIRDVLQIFSADLRATLDAETQVNTSPDLVEAARAALAAQVATYQAKGVRLVLALPAEGLAATRVVGEESRLRRIFGNLLENALRYSPPRGSVTISIEEDTAALKVAVDDEGAGLPTDMTPAQVFALFTKGKVGGGKAGLGMYFCRITVERWGGTIGCLSRIEGGSRFWFRLPKSAGPVLVETRATPKANASVSTSPKSAAAIPGVAKKPRRILLAEDQEDIRALTKYQLERAGHRVTAVADGEAALREAKSGEYDVILLDEEMPRRSGPEVARAVRKRESGAATRVRIMAVTGNNAPEDVKRLLEAGFDSVIGKPFHVQDLIRALESAPHASAADATEASAGDPLLARVGGDRRLLRQMIALFQADVPKRLARLKQALRKADLESLATVAHALKGSVGNFGALEAHAAAEQLQSAARAGDPKGAKPLAARLEEEIAKLRQKLRGYAERPKAKAARLRSRPEKNKAAHRRKRSRVRRSSTRRPKR